MDGVGEWKEILGFHRVLTNDDFIEIHGKKGEARKAARKARDAGKIPVYVAESITDAKEGAWVDNAVMELRTRIDMQVVHIMKERNVAALITLDYIRSDFRSMQNAARNLTLLHKGRVPILLASGAKRIEDLRAPRDIAAVGRTLGLTVPQALAAVSDNWEAFI
ncbi:MAG: RNase subunit p30 [Candidatus Diapherotrites archaeon]|nr:RNase subunit p30 [Candidatus Diapherotrites archaeon]MDN5366898.1 RNase subunit p30 [Candidatus Diapherotrites archaeon]